MQCLVDAQVGEAEHLCGEGAIQKWISVDLAVASKPAAQVIVSFFNLSATLVCDMRANCLPHILRPGFAQGGMAIRIYRDGGIV